jgi:hypothetical protein
MRVNLLVIGSFTLALMIAAGVVSSLVLTTTMGASVAGRSATTSPTAHAPEKPRLGKPPSPTSSAGPPVVGNPGAEKALPRGASPELGMPGGTGQGEQGSGSSPEPGMPGGTGQGEQGSGSPPEPGMPGGTGQGEQGSGSPPELGMPGGTGQGEQGSGSDLEAPVPPAGIVLGQTIDEMGNPHTLVLNVPVTVRESLLHTNRVFAVVSGGSRFSVTGDAAVDSWRFGVDSGVSGAGAPIVVIKGVAGASVQDLAAERRTYASPAELNEDVVGTSTRLNALIAEVISKAEPTHPDRFRYTALARQLGDPGWTGVMIFNATATVPGEILGQPAGTLADREVAALNIGFEARPMIGTPGTLDAFFFGTVDQSQASGDALPPGVRYLRAQFTNGALTAFDQG